MPALSAPHRLRFTIYDLRFWEWIAFIACLLLFVGQTALASPQKSAVVDEEYHLAAGLAFLQTGDFHLFTGHPPLMNALAALPLLFRSDIQLPLDDPSYVAGDYFAFGDVFLWQANENIAHQLIVIGRLPIMAAGTILAAALFFWARQAGGTAAGWIALLLATFDPNLLTHSRLITTDLGLALWMCLAMWQVWRYLEREERGFLRVFADLLLIGILMGLAMMAKFTAVTLWPVLLFLLLFYPSPPSAIRRPISSLHLLKIRFLAFICIALIAYLTIWVFLGFEFGRIPNSRFPFPIPAPSYPHQLWDLFMVLDQEPVPAFLLGQTSSDGWWYYFPVTLIVKTPMPLLLLAAIGLVLLIKRKGWQKTAVFWFPPLFFLLFAMLGKFNIGYRHILPIAPFLILLASQVGHGLTQPNIDFSKSVFIHYIHANPRPILISLTLLWHIIGTARLFPHQEAFFNELVGGPTGGTHVLSDSNLDWGQDLPALQELLTQMDIKQVYLAYYGTSLPEAYSIQYKPLPGFLRFLAGPEIEAYNPYTPPPGWYAISATSLRLGLFYQNRDIYAYFADKEPVARAGYSIYLYKVEYLPGTEIRRVHVAGQSVSDMAPEALGVTAGEQVVVKWTQSSETAVLPPTTPFEQTATFRSLSANFAQAFSLVGSDIPQSTYQSGETINLSLYWQTGTAEIPTPSPATAPPLAAFIHLSGEDPGQIITQYDGWGVALTGLEPGDIIVQHITLTIPPDALPDTYYLRVGLYSPQSGQRLKVVDETADFVTLPPITVISGVDSP